MRRFPDCSHLSLSLSHTHIQQSHKHTFSLSLSLSLFLFLWRWISSHPSCVSVGTCHHVPPSPRERRRTQIRQVRSDEKGRKAWQCSAQSDLNGRERRERERERKSEENIEFDNITFIHFLPLILSNFLSLSLSLFFLFLFLFLSHPLPCMAASMGCVAN